MPNPRGLFARVHRTTQMREASGVVGDDKVDAGSIDVRELALEHAVRDLRILEAERSAESTADGRLRHLDDLDAGHLTSHRPRILLDTQNVRLLARVVVRHP